MAVTDQHATGSALGRNAIIRDLNDRLRQSGRGGRVMMTAGVAALSETERAGVIEAVRAFDGFDADNDPHGEHEFGAVTVGGLNCFWKVDYYDRDLKFGSPDPADPAVTLRVLTLMLKSEY